MNPGIRGFVISLNQFPPALLYCMQFLLETKISKVLVLGLPDFSFTVYLRKCGFCFFQCSFRQWHWNWNFAFPTGCSKFVHTYL